MTLDFQAMVEWLKGLPPEMLTIVLAFCCGYGFRRFPFIPNKLIFPLSVLFAIIGYAVLAEEIDKKSLLWNIVHSVIIGFAFGIAGAVLAVAAHDKALAPLAEKIPFFKFLVCLDDSKPTNPPPPAAEPPHTEP